MCKKFLFGAILTAAVCLTACQKDTELIDDFTTTTVFQTSAYGTAEQTSATAEKSEGLPKIVTNPYGVNKYEATAASESIVPESMVTDSNVPEIRDPISAVEKYIEELAKSENVVYVELHETRIGQSNVAANKYYESPLAEKFGVTEDTLLVPVNVDYYIEYAENSGLESGEKSDYFIVIVDSAYQDGFYVIDTFPYDPQDYYGEIKEVLPDEEYQSVHYLVELDGGLGTVICNNAAMYGEFEAGTRIYIEANGDIYGETPILDAIFMCRESELYDGE